jgi:hypothetical protein
MKQNKQIIALLKYHLPFVKKIRRHLPISNISKFCYQII